MKFSAEMMRALYDDAEKLKQLTGEDHTPVFWGDPCQWPDCECIKRGLNCMMDRPQSPQDTSHRNAFDEPSDVEPFGDLGAVGTVK